MQSGISHPGFVVPLQSFIPVSNKCDEAGFLHAPGMAGKKVHTYVGFTDAFGKQAADSVYTGELTVTL